MLPKHLIQVQTLAQIELRNLDKTCVYQSLLEKIFAPVLRKNSEGNRRKICWLEKGHFKCRGPQNLRFITVPIASVRLL